MKGEKKLYRKTFRMGMSMKDGLYVEATVSKNIDRAVTYAIWVLSSVFSAWLLIKAIRWW